VTALPRATRFSVDLADQSKLYIPIYQYIYVEREREREREI